MGEGETFDPRTLAIYNNERASLARAGISVHDPQ